MSSIEYTVEKNDDLFHVGKSHHINWRFIGHFNNLENLNVVHTGQKILIPTNTQGLSELVDSLNTWFESRDKSDVTAIAVQLEAFARDSFFAPTDLKKWISATHFAPSAETIIWEFYSAGKLTTLSWFIGEFSGEWRKYLSGETR